MNGNLQTLAIVALFVATQGALPSADCSWRFNDNVYDLSALRELPNDFGPVNSNRYAYIFSFCRNANEPACKSRNCTSCQYEKQPLTFRAGLNRWSGSPPPTWDLLNRADPNSGLVIEFTNGDLCRTDGGSSVPPNLKVFVPCDPNGPAVPGPEVRATEYFRECQFTFTVAPSRAGCPLRGSACQLYDPVHGFIFDLHALRNPARDYNGSDGKVPYVMNACGPAVIGGPCTRNKQAICQLETNGQFSAGLGSFDTEPLETYELISQIDPTLGVRVKFSNGDWCFVDGRRVARQTLVSYFCDVSGEDQPTFQVVADEIRCTFSVRHFSKSACPKPATEAQRRLIEQRVLPVHVLHGSLI